MQALRLLTKSFRALSADLHLGPQVTLILGPNGAGKSSLAAAVEYALRGACRWTDGAGRGASVLINHSAAAASVDLDADFGDGTARIISRSITPKGTDLSFDGRGGKDAAAALSARLPLPALLPCMLRTDGFLSLSGKEQQDLLFALSGGETDSDWFKERLTDDEQEALGDVLATLLKGSALSEKLYTTAYALRTAANKAAKDAQATLSATPEVTVEAVDDAAVAKTKDAITKKRERLAKLQQRIGGAAAAAKAQELAGLRVTQAQEDVKRCETALAEMSEQPEAPEELTIEQLRGAVEQANTEYAAAIQKAASLNATRQAAQDQLDDFTHLEGRCVLGNVDCPMTAEQRGKIIKAEQKRIDGLETEITAQQQAATEAEKAHKQAAEAVTEAQDKQQAQVRWQETRDRLTADLGDANNRHAQAIAAYQETAAPVTDGLESDAQILQREIDEAEQALQERLQAAGAAEKRKLLEEQVEKTKAEAEMLDALVKKLSPDGLPAQAMRETIGGVIEAINAELAQFTEMQIAAEPGKDFQLMVAAGDNLSIPAFCLCESEQLRVGAAIQVAFAKLTRFGFVVVDAADRLDEQNLPLLVQLLVGAGVQALVLSSRRMGDEARAWVLELGGKIHDLQGGLLAA